MDMSLGRTKEYSEKKLEGELPDKLKGFSNSINWPVCLDDELHLGNYFHEINGNNEHTGIDIQSHFGTLVFAPEDSKVIYFQKDYYQEKRGTLSDVFLLGLESNIVYVLSHLENDSINEAVGPHTYINLNSVNRIGSGEKIGEIGFWKQKINSSFVEEKFGLHFHHLHFSTYRFEESALKRQKLLRYHAFNPLLVLKNLY